MLISLKIDLPKSVRAYLREQRKSLKNKRAENAKSADETRWCAREAVKFYFNTFTALLTNAKPAASCGCPPSSPGSTPRE